MLVNIVWFVVYCSLVLMMQLVLIIFLRRLEPGPTHLDTCQMFVEISNGVGDKELSTFMGYVDRGQRIECRFSKRPIRMSGLVVKAENSVTGRFTMEKTSGSSEAQGWVQRLW